MSGQIYIYIFNAHAKDSYICAQAFNFRNKMLASYWLKHCVSKHEVDIATTMLDSTTLHEFTCSYNLTYNSD